VTRATLRAERREVFPGVTVDPGVQFGEPYITGKGITCAALVGYFRGGDSVCDIAADFGIEPAEVEAALRWFLLDPRARKRRMEGK
jgi:uncharacterized protein (DUF433 family)